MYVQLKEAVEFCCSFLLTKICLENCAEVMRLLEDFSVGVEGVQEQLDNFLLDNFVPLMSRPDFLSYLGLERLQVSVVCSPTFSQTSSTFCRIPYPVASSFPACERGVFGANHHVSCRRT